MLSSCLMPLMPRSRSIPAFNGSPWQHRIMHATSPDELTRRRPAASTGRLSMSLFDATVDLNPHQIDAAMFALESPLRKGVVLADEVGLGKTIEAGLVLCQHWAKRRRRLLVICPASLRKQWSLELQEKFNLPTVILDALGQQAPQISGFGRDPTSEAHVTIALPAWSGVSLGAAWRRVVATMLGLADLIRAYGTALCELGAAP